MNDKYYLLRFIEAQGLCVSYLTLFEPVSPDDIFVECLVVCYPLISDYLFCPLSIR